VWFQPADIALTLEDNPETAVGTNLPVVLLSPS
jgi:hypothetical protein